MTRILLFLSLMVVLVGATACRNSRGRARRDGGARVIPDAGPGRDSSRPRPGDEDAGGIRLMDAGMPPTGVCVPRSSGTGTGPVFGGSTADVVGSMSGSCGGGSGPEAVHEWIAPSAGTFSIDTFGSEPDTVLYALDGGCSGAELACNDDAMEYQSQITVTVAAGQRLMLVVDTFDSLGGPYTINIVEGGVSP